MARKPGDGMKRQKHYRQPGIETTQTMKDFLFIVCVIFSVMFTSLVMGGLVYRIGSEVKPNWEQRALAAEADAEEAWKLVQELRATLAAYDIELP